jgi:hypothetical protein
VRFAAWARDGACGGNAGKVDLHLPTCLANGNAGAGARQYRSLLEASVVELFRMRASISVALDELALDRLTSQ